VHIFRLHYFFRAFHANRIDPSALAKQNIKGQTLFRSLLSRTLVALIAAASSLAAEKAVDKTPVAASNGNGWVTPAVKAPGVTHHIFRSASLNGSVSYHLYRPAAYEQEKDARFPVLYWLHGSGGGQQGIAPLANFFDEAIRSGKVRPFLVLFVNGLP
jgi:poly(3-hydroxybutyrate) depolymerase